MLMVLAESALKCAAGEKDGTGAPAAADTGLLPKVGGGADDPGKSGTGATAAGSVITSHSTAAAGTIVADVFHPGNLIKAEFDEKMAYTK